MIKFYLYIYRRMVVLKKSIIGIAAISLLLVGCSNSEAKKDKVKMGQVMQDGHKTISYIVDGDEDNHNLTKNSKLDRYIISENGKITVYNDTGDTKLGKIAQMNEDKLEDYIKDQDKKYFEDEKDQNIQDQKDEYKKYKDNKESMEDAYNDYKQMDSDEKKHFLHINEVSEKDMVDQIAKNNKADKYNQKQMKKLKAKKYEAPKPRDLKIKVKTDDSGNNTKEESINLGSAYFDSPGKYESDKDARKNYMAFSNVQTATDIYDKRYVGISDMEYADDNGYEDDYSYLITEGGKKSEGGILDSPKDKKVKIDEEDYEDE